MRGINKKKKISLEKDFLKVVQRQIFIYIKNIYFQFLKETT